MKACSKCGVVKPMREFNRHSRNPDGLKKECRACQSAYNAGRYADNPERFKQAARNYDETNAQKVAARRAASHAADRVARNARVAEFYRANPDRAASKREYRSGYRRAQPEKEKAWGQTYRRRHPERGAAQTALRNARKRQATPAWANLELVAAFYTMAAWLTQETGVLHHVDHREPLQGRHVCGLHNEFNLQVLPAQINIAKGNRPSDVVGLR